MRWITVALLIVLPFATSGAGKFSDKKLGGVVSGVMTGGPRSAMILHIPDLQKFHKPVACGGGTQVDQMFTFATLIAAGTATDGTDDVFRGVELAAIVTAGDLTEVGSNIGSSLIAGDIGAGDCFDGDAQGRVDQSYIDVRNSMEIAAAAGICTVVVGGDHDLEQGDITQSKARDQNANIVETAESGLLGMATHFNPTEMAKIHRSCQNFRSDFGTTQYPASASRGSGLGLVTHSEVTLLGTQWHIYALPIDPTSVDVAWVTADIAANVGAEEPIVLASHAITKCALNACADPDGCQVGLGDEESNSEVVENQGAVHYLQSQFGGDRRVVIAMGGHYASGVSQCYCGQDPLGVLGAPQNGCASHSNTDCGPDGDQTCQMIAMTNNFQGSGESTIVALIITPGDNTICQRSFNPIAGETFWQEPAATSQRWADWCLPLNTVGQ